MKKDFILWICAILVFMIDNTCHICSVSDENCFNPVDSELLEHVSHVKWYVPEVLLGNAVQASLIKWPYFSVWLFNKIAWYSGLYAT
jgi:hypothetical protein